MTISETARVARDRARRGDGKFGEQAKDRPPLTPHEEAVTGLVLDTGGVSDEFVTGDVTDFSRAHLPWSPSSGADRMEARVAEAPPSPARGGDAGEVEPPRSVSSALWSIQSGVENQDLMWQFGGDLDDAYRGVEFLEQQLEAVTAERDQARDELVTARRSVAGYRCDAEGHLVSYEHERERSRHWLAERDRAMDERNAAVAVADVLKKRIESVVEDMADRRCDDYLVAAWARELESVLGPDVVG